MDVMCHTHVNPKAETKITNTWAVSCRSTGIEVRQFYGKNISFLLYNIDFYPCLKFYDSKHMRTWVTDCVGRVPPEKLSVSQSVKKSPAFYVFRRFITAFTRSRHLSLSLARSIQSKSPFHILNIRFNIIPPFTPRSFPSGISPSRLLTKTLQTPHLSPLRATSPSHLLLNLITRKIFCEGYRG